MQHKTVTLVGEAGRGVLCLVARSCIGGGQAGRGRVVCPMVSLHNTVGLAGMKSSHGQVTQHRRAVLEQEGFTVQWPGHTGQSGHG